MEVLICSKMVWGGLTQKIFKQRLAEGKSVNYTSI